MLGQHGEHVVLLFSDVDMPGSIDGFGLAHHVADHWPHIEIVMASGHVLPQAGAMPQKATFITKPFSRLTVIDHLQETLPEGKKPAPLKRAV